MEPTFADGALVLIEPVGVRRFMVFGVGVFGRGLAPDQIRAGDVIIARHPFKNLDVIKFVAESHDDGYLSLRSPSGEDSRQFGRILGSSVKGRVSANLSTRQRVATEISAPHVP